MLQYPINVYPDHIAFDPSRASDADIYDRSIKFTFKGDILSAVFWRVYDYTTGRIALEGTFFEDELLPLCYNDNEIRIPNVLYWTTDSVKNLFPLGKYVLQMMLTETRSVRSGALGHTYSRVNAHDRYVSRGRLTQAYTTSDTTTIMIEDNINVIYPWNRDGNIYSASVIEVTDRPDPRDNFTINAAEMVIHIGNEVKPIESYDASTGEITLESALLYDYPAGTQYQIYANYLITELYYFETADQSIITPKLPVLDEMIYVTWDAYGGTFGAKCWNGDEYYPTKPGTSLKYFTYDFVKVDEEENDWLIFRSDKIYSQDISFKFVDDYDDIALCGYRYRGEVEDDSEYPADAEINDVCLNLWNDKYFVKEADGWVEFEGCGGNWKSHNYKVKLHCELQNGMYADDSINFTAPARQSSELRPNRCEIELDNDNNWAVINIMGGHPSGAMRFRIYRVYESAAMYNVNPHKELIGDIGSFSFVDYIVGSHGKYRYMVVPYDRISGNIYEPIVSDTVENNFYGYTMTALHDTGKIMNGKPLYIAGDNWKLMAEIDDTDNVQNINRVTHVGNGKYATVTASENNYVSGSLTAELGRMNCTAKEFRNDAAIMAEWRDFISQDCPFILRNQKGDVWLVRVTEGGSIKYGEEGRQIDSTVTFSWVECGSIYDYLIQGEDINDQVEGG